MATRTRTTAGGTLVVHGYRELVRACVQADADTRKSMRATFRAVGEPVRREAAELFSQYGAPRNRATHAKAAAGYRTRVRQRGVEVEQSARRTTGKHPEYGRAQMRHALLPALKHEEPETVARFDEAILEVCERWARG